MENHNPLKGITVFQLSLFTLYIIYFVLNFMGLPILKYVYLGILLNTFYIIVARKPREAILAIMLLSFIEGQGRIVFGYNPIFRIIFDVLLGIIVLKIFIIKKSLFDLKIVKSPLVFMIFAHFVWFTLELFNPLGAGVLPSFATSKFYIFPFFMFFSFTALEIGKDQRWLMKFSLINSILAIVLCALCIYQKFVGETLLYSISPEYYSLFKKFLQFTGPKFRPWGTSAVAGAASVLLFVTSGFLFLGLLNYKKLYTTIIFFITIGLSWITLFICQVRSAFLKHILTVFGVGFVFMITGRMNSRTIVSIGVSLSILVGVVISNVDKFDSLTEEFGLQEAIERIEDLDSSKGKGISAQRMGFGEMYRVISGYTRWPFGYGVGMTSGFLPQFGERRKELVDIPKYKFWNGDNLLIWGFLEMGIGAIFYFGIVIMNSLYLLKGFLVLRPRDRERARLVGTSFVVSTIILLGNLGAVSIPFNPDSFYYWFWVAMGMYQINAPEEAPVTQEDSLETEIEETAEDEQNNAAQNA